MARISRTGRALAALGGLLILAAPALTQNRVGLSALARLEPGLWQLRDLDGGDTRPQSLCVADPAILLQIQHRNSPCTRLVIANDRNSATVHYTCPASGFGRTSVRVETPRLAKIETQGISENAPFVFRLEARRTGACARSTASAGR